MVLLRGGFSSAIEPKIFPKISFQAGVLFIFDRIQSP